MIPISLFTFMVLFFIGVLLALYFYLRVKNKHEIIPPKLYNNPSYDVIVDERNPLLSFFNAQGGDKYKVYEIQLDTNDKFTSTNLIHYKHVEKTSEFITEKKVDNAHTLKDKTRYYWRVRAIGESGAKSDWAISRFYVDSEASTNFSNLARAPIKNIEVSDGYNAKNIIDWDDPGLISFWQSPPPGEDEQWIKFDLGKPATISRIWILSNPTDKDGWLRDFVLQSSSDAKVWKNINDTDIKNNDTFRNIIDFKPKTARYFRILVTKYIGYAAQINEIILFTPEKIPTIKIPKNDYILVIGNEHNGFTFTNLAKHIENLEMKLEVVCVPYYCISWEMIEQLPNKPVAIVLSGNNADYPNLPMFEYNGEFEIIRKSNIPILGICAGHQFLAMAYGYTKARSMGYADISAIKPRKQMSRIKIIKKDKIFWGISNNFTAPEIHGWAVAEPAEEFEVIAKSDYIQAQKSTKRLIYGIQFHGEINVSYNQAKRIIKNFLILALEKREEEKIQK